MYTLHLRIMRSYNAQDIRRRRFPHEEYHRYTFSPTDDFEHKAARCVSVLMIGYTLTNALQSKLLQFSVNHGIMNHQNSRILRILMPKRHTALEFITAYFVECAYASRCIGSERSVTLEKFRL